LKTNFIIFRNIAKKTESSPQYSQSNFNRGILVVQNQLHVDSAFPDRVSQTRTRQKFNGFVPVPGEILTARTF
jgi:hypothetical protein